MICLAKIKFLSNKLPNNEINLSLQNYTLTRNNSSNDHYKLFKISDNLRVIETFIIHYLTSFVYYSFLYSKIEMNDMNKN